MKIRPIYIILIMVLCAGCGEENSGAKVVATDFSSSKSTIKSNHNPIISPDMYDKIIELSMNNFWGKATLKDGSIVQPESEAERTTLPIIREDILKVIQAGEVSSIADWCGLNWQQNYFRVTKSARSSKFNGKQVAFVGILHGVTMGVVDSALKGKECSQKIKVNIEEQLRKNSNKLINFASSAPDLQKPRY